MLKFIHSQAVIENVEKIKDEIKSKNKTGNE